MHKNHINVNKTTENLKKKPTDSRTQQTKYLCRVIVLSHYDFFNIQSRIVSFPQVDEPAKKYKDNCGVFLSGEVNLAHNSPTECI